MDKPFELPLRQIARLRAEMAVGAYRLASDIFPDDPLLSVEFGMVALRCLPEWTGDDAVMAPAHGMRAISVRQIARSLGRPPETVRRRVALLRDRGMVAISPAGVMLATDPAAAATVAGYLLGVHDLMVRLIEDLRLTCDLTLPVGRHVALSLDAIIGRAIEVLLLPVDTFRLAGQQQSFLLWGALTAVAVRDITYDPLLARRYASAIPPDALRADISLRKLADALRLPYATAWRQMQALHQRGLVTRLGNDRWTVLTDNLLIDTAMAVAEPPSVLTLRKVRELTLLGFDPARAADHYRGVRPTPTFLGIANAPLRRGYG